MAEYKIQTHCVCGFKYVPGEPHVCAQKLEDERKKRLVLIDMTKRLTAELKQVTAERDALIIDTTPAPTPRAIPPVATIAMSPTRPERALVVEPGGNNNCNWHCEELLEALNSVLACKGDPDDFNPPKTIEVMLLETEKLNASSNGTLAGVAGNEPHLAKHIKALRLTRAARKGHRRP